jgi:hypothetical protein
MKKIRFVIISIMCISCGREPLPYEPIIKNSIESQMKLTVRIHDIKIDSVMQPSVVRAMYKKFALDYKTDMFKNEERAALYTEYAKNPPTIEYLTVKYSFSDTDGERILNVRSEIIKGDTALYEIK